MANTPFMSLVKPPQQTRVNTRTAKEINNEIQALCLQVNASAEFISLFGEDFNFRYFIRKANLPFLSIRKLRTWPTHLTGALSANAAIKDMVMNIARGQSHGLARLSIKVSLKFYTLVITLYRLVAASVRGNSEDFVSPQQTSSYFVKQHFTRLCRPKRRENWNRACDIKSPTRIPFSSQDQLQIVRDGLYPEIQDGGSRVLQPA